MAQILSNGGLSQAEVHPSARVVEPGIVETSPAQWAYALVLPLVPDSDAHPTLIADVEMQVLEGYVGVGLLDRPGTGFISETLVPAGEARRVVLRGAIEHISALVFRNASPAGPSRFAVRGIAVSGAASTASAYPVAIAARTYEAEPIPAEREGVFEDNAADRINRARMDFIRSLPLVLQGRRVLDAGAGVGHFARLYADGGARVVAIEGRSDNVRLLLARHPDVEAHEGDIQDMSLERLGRFDIVHCFGLLYHLDSPVAALRRIERVCDDVLLLETMVCDAAEPVMLLADETRSVNQALAGLGCRPSPSFVALALNRVGFRFVYGAAVPPQHPDFQFDWRNDQSTARDGHNLRCVFVASRRPLLTPLLHPLIEG
jgi:SAM-dependent methyltransferase